MHYDTTPLGLSATFEIGLLGPSASAKLWGTDVRYLSNGNRMLTQRQPLNFLWPGRSLIETQALVTTASADVYDRDLD